jgi:hypothetical protein
MAFLGLVGVLGREDFCNRTKDPPVPAGHIGLNFSHVDNTGDNQNCLLITVQEGNKTKFSSNVPVSLLLFGLPCGGNATVPRHRRHI